MEYREFFSPFALGALFGAGIVLMVVLTGGSQPETGVSLDQVNNSSRVGDRVSFDQVNVSHREIGVGTGAGDRLQCGASRFNEVQISDSSFIYRNASCEFSLQVNGSTVTAPVEGDVLFKTQSLSSYSIGFDFDEEYLICDVSEEKKEKTGEGSFVYNGADCTGYMGNLYSEWNDPEFENFNVHDQGRELLRNQSNSSSR